jgi:site-specific DNA recombinase
MYVEKPDGRIDDAVFDEMLVQWRDEQEECQRQISRLTAADQSYLEDGVRILELAHNAQRLFAQQAAREKRRLLNFVVSNSSWKDDQLHATFQQPFDIIAEASLNSEAATAAGKAKTA